LLVYCLNVLSFELFDLIKEKTKSFNGHFHRGLIRKVNDKSDRQKIAHLYLLEFTVLANVEIELILLRQTLVVFKMIHDGFVAVFAQEVKPDIEGVRCPLQIE